MTRRQIIAILFAAAVVLAFAIRWQDQGDQRTEGIGRSVRFTSPDCLYHMRRVRFAVEHFPFVPFFDPTMNFPEGGVSIWPPLFDVILAAPARIVFGPNAARTEIEELSAAVPPILGMLAVLAIGLSAGAVRRRTGWLVALFAALSVGHVKFTQYAHTDQHVLESLTGALAFFLFLRARDGDDKGRRGRELWAALGLGLAVLSWQGAIFWGAIFAASLAADALRKEPARRADPFAASAVILGGAAAISASGVWFWARGDSLPFTFISFGWFQPEFLLFIAAGVMVISLTSEKLFRRADLSDDVVRSTAPPRTSWRLAILGAALLVMTPRFPELFRGLFGGFGYVFKISEGSEGVRGYLTMPRAMLAQVAETRPLFQDGPRECFESLSFAAFLVPAIFVIWFWRAKNGPRRRVHGLLLIWGVVTVALAVAQRLNIYYAVPLAGISLAEIARQARTRIRKGFPRWRTRMIPGLAAGAIVVLALLNLLPGLRREFGIRHSAAGKDLLDTLEWARIHLARGENKIDIYDPSILPPSKPVPFLETAQAAISPWALGHEIHYYAELPTVANNFGYGFDDSVRFLLAESEEEALAIARKRRARWIFVTDIISNLDKYGDTLGRGPYFEPGPRGPSPTAAYFRTIQARLFELDGRGPNPLDHIHLIYRSKTGVKHGERIVPLWKIFQIDQNPPGTEAR